MKEKNVCEMSQLSGEITCYEQLRDRITASFNEMCADLFSKYGCSTWKDDDDCILIDRIGYVYIVETPELMEVFGNNYALLDIHLELNRRDVLVEGGFKLTDGYDSELIEVFKHKMQTYFGDLMKYFNGEPVCYDGHFEFSGFYNYEN